MATVPEDPSPLPRRPMLAPALARVWRAPDRLQLGVGTRAPVVLAGLEATDARFLLGLDGRRDRAATLAHAATLGLPVSRAERVLELLDAAGCLADGSADARALAALETHDRDRLAPDVAALSLLPPTRSLGLPAFAARRTAHIEVRGAGRVGAAVTTLLAAAGVRTVSVTDDEAVRPADLAPLGPHRGSVGRPRSDAAVDAARFTVPSVRRDTDQPVDLVVLTGAPVVDPGTGDDLLSRRTPHLPVTLVGTTATVGPLVTPRAGPCLRCLDLHRCDRDPDWPVVAAQLQGPDRGSRAGRPAAEACDVVLATCAASLAALLVLAWLGHRALPTRDSSDEEVPPGTAYVLRLPGGQPREIRYTAHPRCGCAWGTGQ